MIAASRVGALVFTVADLARTERFYRDSLGLDIARQPGEAHTGGDFLMATLPGDMLLIFFQGDARPGSSPVVVFSVDGGIDRTVEALAARGVSIVTPVSEAPGGWSADFADPDGHVLSLYQEGAR
ncbi:VOC family protein [Coralloluteibacterium stylophorae]|uniref:VOC family protein n=1 Tax=Coralloluteibacterium stylophorae TaxID=1776034 RepID=A0A8J7VTA6_9GAMM|nr:VOC family protein [Coralloluteibacterium stylophorae]MBS7458650.1 VOC family protein [Coralloluteibacterium stylophorae]